MSEWLLCQHLREIANKNEAADSHVCLPGGGVYDHHVPAVVDTIANRGEFLTALALSARDQSRPDTGSSWFPMCCGALIRHTGCQLFR